ncbi:hypothetical protein LTR92_002554 [Exophiala xenobiotica]|nr:hypothetical protein LTR92_002554 [Exophiala xenobiotica]
MNFRNVVKDGWHPKGKEGGKESWRGDFKGINQVAGWMGKGRDPNKQEAVDHVSRPLATLKDPTSFGPPPKNVNYHGGAALPNEITPHRSGLGAPLTQEEIQSAASRTTSGPTEEEIEEEQRPAGPPLPYRADRTGLRTDHLPPPPVHRDVNRSPIQMIDTQAAQPPRPKPGLPPRLPSRQNTTPTPTPPPVVTSPPPQPAPPAYESIPTHRPTPQRKTSSNNYGINQAAANRLGKAGISVPGLGIGTGSHASSNPWQNEQSHASSTAKRPSPQPQPQPAPNQLSELQSRFIRMTDNTSLDNSSQNTTSSPHITPAQAQSTPPPPTQPAQGTTWAEKQAAFRTAQSMHASPSSVTPADAAAAARTANSFRERHQDTISSAGQKANQWNKKYNVAGRLNSFLEKHSSPTSETPPPLNNANANATATPTSPPPPATSPELVASISRKPPPPPPPKKPAGMHGNANALGGSGGVVSPPPVPLGTKPSYS